MQRRALDIDGTGVEIDDQLAGADNTVRMALAATDNGMDTGDQLAAVERLGQIIVGAEAKAFDLVIQLRQAGQD